jgi:hypothetical protein
MIPHLGMGTLHVEFMNQTDVVIYEELGIFGGKINRFKGFCQKYDSVNLKNIYLVDSYKYNCKSFTFLCWVLIFIPLEETAYFSIYRMHC